VSLQLFTRHLRRSNETRLNLRKPIGDRLPQKFRS
jgi:hypothetical protein